MIVRDNVRSRASFYAGTAMKTIDIGEASLRDSARRRPMALWAKAEGKLSFAQSP